MGLPKYWFRLQPPDITVIEDRSCLLKRARLEEVFVPRCVKYGKPLPLALKPGIVFCGPALFWIDIRAYFLCFCFLQNYAEAGWEMANSGCPGFIKKT